MLRRWDFVKLMALHGVFLLYLLNASGFERFSQHDYVEELEHAEAGGLNRSLMDYLRVRNVKFNRTYKVVNFGFNLKKDIGGDGFKMNVKGWQFFHNEYRPTPLAFDVKICEIMQTNLFGMKALLTSGNMTLCPVRKGSYYINNFRLNSVELPPHLPTGRWKIALRAFDGDSFIGGIRFYTAIIEKAKFKP